MKEELENATSAIEKMEAEKAQREKQEQYTGLSMKVAKLQIKEEGPGSYSVRSTGMSAKVQTHIKLLLDRLKGNIYINGQLLSRQKAFKVLVMILSKQETAQVKIVR